MKTTGGLQDGEEFMNTGVKRCVGKTKQCLLSCIIQGGDFYASLRLVKMSICIGCKPAESSRHRCEKQGFTTLFLCRVQADEACTRLCWYQPVFPAVRVSVSGRSRCSRSPSSNRTRLSMHIFCSRHCVRQFDKFRRSPAGIYRVIEGKMTLLQESSLPQEYVLSPIIAAYFYDCQESFRVFLFHFFFKFVSSKVPLVYVPHFFIMFSI